MVESDTTQVEERRMRFIVTELKHLIWVDKVSVAELMAAIAYIIEEERKVKG